MAMKQLRKVLLPARRSILEPGTNERRLLPLGDGLYGELLDRLVEQPIEVKLRLQVQKHAAQTDCGAVHEHEFARHRDRALPLQGLVHAEGLAPPVFGWLDSIGDRGDPAVEPRAPDRARPGNEDVDG